MLFFFRWLRVWVRLQLLDIPVSFWRFPAMTDLEQLQALVAELVPLKAAKKTAEEELDASQIAVDAAQVSLDDAKVTRQSKADAYTAADAVYDSKLQEIIDLAETAKAAS